MVLVRPEQRIGNQKIGYAGTAVIVYQSAPMGMGALPGVHVFIDAGAVKHSHSIGIPWEMGRHPVKYDADSLSVHIVHKVHEILRGTVTAGRGIIPCYLIPQDSSRGCSITGMSSTWVYPISFTYSASLGANSR